MRVGLFFDWKFWGTEEVCDRCPSGLFAGEAGRTPVVSGSSGRT